MFTNKCNIMNLKIIEFYENRNTGRSHLVVYIPLSDISHDIIIVQ